MAAVGAWSIVSGPSKDDMNKIEAYDSIVIINEHLRSELRKANTQLIEIKEKCIYCAD